MADNIWDDEDENEEEEATGSDLVKKLRKQLNQANAAKKAAETELATLRPAARNTQVSSILKDLNVDTKYAKLVPTDLDASEESIKAWASEYGFAPTSETTTTTEPPIDNGSSDGTGDDQSAALAAQWQRIQTQSSASGSTSPDIESQQIAMLQAAAKAADGNSDLFAAFLNGERAIPNQ